MFDKSTRTLIAMLLERDAVNSISGSLEDGRCWTVSIHRPNLFRDNVTYDGCIAGAYSADFTGSTLDETLGKMAAYLADEAELAEMVGRATA